MKQLDEQHNFIKNRVTFERDYISDSCFTDLAMFSML